MALKKRIELESGIVVQEAYIRVTDFFISYISGLARIHVSYYADKNARLSGKNPIKIAQYELFNEPVPSVEAVYDVVLKDISPVSLTVGSISVSGVNAIDIASKLNNNSEFNRNWTAGAYSMTGLNIAALRGGSCCGDKGNNINITGNITKVTQPVIGKPSKKPDFEKYFDIKVLANPIAASYNYLKTLPDFADAVDILE